MNLGNIGMQPCRDLNEPVEGLAKSYGVQKHKRGRKWDCCIQCSDATDFDSVDFRSQETENIGVCKQNMIDSPHLHTI